MKTLKSFFNWLWLCIVTFFTGLWDSICDWFKQLTFKGVMRDFGNGIWKFLNWHFAALVLGFLGWMIVGSCVSAFLGWFASLMFLIMLVINLSKNQRDGAA